MFSFSSFQLISKQYVCEVFYKKRNINVCLEFVFNVTSDDFRRGRKSRGEVFVQRFH